MKKKITTVALLFLAICSNMEANAQSSEMKHFTVGIGAAFDPDGEQLTQHTKFDYNITPKFAIGLKNNLKFWDNIKTQENLPDAMGVQTTVSWRNTIFNNSSLVGSYSFLGSNQNDKKLSVSVFAGLGLRYDVFREDYTHKNLPSNTYMIDRSFLKTKFYYIHSGISAFYKIGPGKIFIELPVLTDLLMIQKNSSEFDSAPSLNSENTYKHGYSKEKLYNYYLGTEVGFNLGYQINF